MNMTVPVLIYARGSLAATLKVFGFFALTALQIINQHLFNQYIAIKGALGVLALDTFLISDFFPKPDARFNTVNALSGLGTILSVVSGFVLVIGPGLAATGNILPAVGGFLGSVAASKSNPLVSQQEFAPKVRNSYNCYISALDKAAVTLFEGNRVNTDNGGFNITDMMAGGAWVNSSSLTRFRDIETNLTVEILSRSIDALWKTPPSNKVWVLYVNLDDDRENNEMLDGGVYYTYNLIEAGDKRGYVGYPWGGNLLQEKFGINLTWVTEASAKSYRLAKRNGIDPLNVAGAVGTKTFLEEAVEDDGAKIALVDQAGRYPGSWTLTVCDASTWGRGWNWDYLRSDWNNDYTNPSTGDFGTSPKHQTHPP
ncbi:MAG: hypothetical protein Q9209_007129 [Squamulea sp. 1 TL-2023]